MLGRQAMEVLAKTATPGIKLVVAGAEMRLPVAVLVRKRAKKRAVAMAMLAASRIRALKPGPTRMANPELPERTTRLGWAAVAAAGTKTRQILASM